MPKLVDENQLDAFNQGGDPEALKKLGIIGAEILKLMAYIDQLEETAKQARSELHRLRSERMPEVMDEAGMSQITLNGGMTFTLKNDVSGSFPRDGKKNELAVEWLKSKGFDDILKTKLEAIFPRHDHYLAENIANRISNQCEPKLTSTVHPSTLKKFARDALRDGQDIDLDLLGLHSYRLVEVKRK